MKTIMLLAVLTLVLTASAALGQQGTASTSTGDTPGSPVTAKADNATKLLNEEFVARDIFHVVGLPNLQRNNRLDLLLYPDEMRFEKKGKILLSVPYSRVRHIEVISGERHYGKATYAAAIATPFAVGSLFILKKRHVDTFLLEFLNERDGVMNVIVQFPEGQGVRCGDVLAKHGLVFEENLTKPTVSVPKTGE